MLFRLRTNILLKEGLMKVSVVDISVFFNFTSLFKNAENNCLDFVAYDSFS